jgi:hypothetical protein
LERPLGVRWTRGEAGTLVELAVVPREDIDVSIVTTSLERVDGVPGSRRDRARRSPDPPGPGEGGTTGSDLDDDGRIVQDQAKLP